MLYNKEKIQEIIPHREPFLLVDEVEDIFLEEGKEKIIGYKYVDENEEYFKGHFPSKKVMPGVLVLESLAQCGAVALLRKVEYLGKLVFFAGANNVKWRKMVVPGDKLRLEVKLNSLRHGIGSGEAKAYVANELACEATISFVVR